MALLKNDRTLLPCDLSMIDEGAQKFLDLTNNSLLEEKDKFEKEVKRRY